MNAAIPAASFVYNPSPGHEYPRSSFSDSNGQRGNRSVIFGKVIIVCQAHNRANKDLIRNNERGKANPDELHNGLAHSGRKPNGIASTGQGSGQASIIYTMRGIES